MSDPGMPRFSIVVVCHGRREVTERCLQSLEVAFGDRLGSEVELVLVDNASPDDTADLLRTWKDRATVIVLDENRNFGGGNNVGARAAKGEAIVLLNNDTVVSAGSLDELALQALESGVGIAGCRLLYPDGTLQHAGYAWWRGQRRKRAAGAYLPPRGRETYRRHAPVRTAISSLERAWRSGAVCFST